MLFVKYYVYYYVLFLFGYARDMLVISALPATHFPVKDRSDIPSHFFFFAVSLLRQWVFL